jgi:hypothetical protein
MPDEGYDYKASPTKAKGYALRTLGFVLMAIWADALAPSDWAGELRQTGFVGAVWCLVAAMLSLAPCAACAAAGRYR